MKNIKNIIGKTIKDVNYDSDRDSSDLTIKFEDGTEVIISTEYNAPNMWCELITNDNNNNDEVVRQIDKDFMQHLNNLDKSNKRKDPYDENCCGV
jgi:frataxin-like iron-binding protein CyaY